jgi:ubiquinone/menaquinone biosynthesis C-methylase UbiE
MSSNNFQELSYRLHEDHFKTSNKLTDAVKKTWFEEDTVDYWRSIKMYNLVLPVLKQYPGSKWLTVGNGRYGLDSVRLKKLDNSIDVMPSDISPHLLEEAKEKGFIDRFSVENAENMSFADDEFDFAYCKDSFHHFPRPYMALYEMIRVAKKGIVLIEPNEGQPRPLISRLVRKVKNLVKKLIGRKVYHSDHWNFEESGNYIYSVSKREMQKAALGLQLPVAAFCYFNDSYEEGVEFEKMSPNSALFRRIKRNIWLKNLKCRLGLAKYNGIMVLFLKETPSENVLKELEEKGFSVEKLPRNPHLPA